MSTSAEPEVRPTPEPEPPEQPGRSRKRPSLVVDTHNLLGIIAAVGTIVVSVTGILLNHIELFNLAGPAPQESSRQMAGDAPPAGFEYLPVDDVIDAGREHLGDSDPDLKFSRAVWRVNDGAVEVRFEGSGPPSSVTVDAADGRVLGTASRHDLDLTQAHSGELIGGPWVILSDLVGLALITLVVLGVVIWLRRSRSRGGLAGGRPGTLFTRANWWFHLVGGLAAAVFLVVLSVTGILLNHKRELGIMADPPTLPDHREEQSYTPLGIDRMIESALAVRGAGFEVADVRSIDYRPKGYAKVRFTDNDHEVIVDGGDGSLIKQSRRWDVWIEDLHSGLLFGAKGWMLSDFGAVMAILLTLNGVYLWLYPTWRARSRREAGQ
ncbi:MAG: PepSY-associated TM helix domain-containing protein [Actinomycetota bacterium]